MSGLSGNNGKVKVDDVEVAKIINWNVSVDVQQTKRTTADTAPFPSRTTGNKDVTGDFTIQITALGGMPSDLATAFLAGTQIQLDLIQLTGKEIEGLAKMEGLTTSADVDGGEDQQATFTFGADGAWTISSET